MRDDTEVVSDVRGQVDRSDQVLQSLRLLGDLVEVVLGVRCDQDGEVEVLDGLRMFLKFIEVILGLSNVVDRTCQ